MTARLLPEPDALSAPFWASCAEHVLALPRCAHCKTLAFPPDITCPNCHSLEPGFRFEPVAPTGRIRTWTVIRQSFLGGFETPFLLVDVELDVQPGLRMIGQLLDGPDAVLAIGDRVEVVFDELAPGVAAPAFTLATIS